ncbi:immunity protein YezG family protein [Parendozoicomonas haliclonae]|uniref:DUF600 family protein n=1 Tax=Parendozoicomonas haliclonae TaxID=1960125 RepID=A0A1X7AR60_9GAMM|nr:immunity protein YezG family protein [Parendozoicomonas haliclonae]SMA50632.1 hypothetical protein EHSB41UT_04449 [Parendozoicomonas haliclonae]
MFDTVDDIYQFIGQAIYNALPDEWDEAKFTAILIEIDHFIESRQHYSLGGDIHSFDIEDTDEDIAWDEAFYALFKLMRKSESDIPWNKAQFSLLADGSFDLEFKYDPDLQWLNTVERDSASYKAMNSKDILKIKTWDGLPEDNDRTWIKQ